MEIIVWCYNMHLSFSVYNDASYVILYIIIIIIIIIIIFFREYKELKL